MILKEVLDKTITFFKQKNLETPRLDAELLLAHGLGIERIQLYLKYDQPLKEGELEKLRELVRRRSLGEPVAYILGKKEFYKYTFKVNPEVLIPRPETESLVELSCEAIEKYKSLNPDQDLVILELGAGSGCIAISLAKEFPESKIFAVEKSLGAFGTLKENSILNSCENMVPVLEDAENVEQVILKTNSNFDFVISNPPYIDIDDQEIQESVKAFEPHVALFAEQQGLYFILSWIEKYTSLLKPGGVFIFEIGHKQAELLSFKITNPNLFSEIKVLKDLSGKDRFLFLQKKRN